ncbi:uncharacterized protein LOC135636913 [Musa acuminata AAA Group]|uniref:uncharacterized protein LOC135636913 n=1 Tax=Musa acuminata AAA Group TaxID=214697 RepID=UPI0008A0E39B|nr:PREDICTED: uncharacterized protein LOC103999224 isoform X1 [Musa acuminata subsp. malaccensis]
MTHPWVDDSKFSSSTSQTNSHTVFSRSTFDSSLKCSHRNVSRLLAWREISPRAKHCRKRLWGEGLGCTGDCVGLRCDTDVRHALMSWVEAESLCYLSARYCPLVPPPRSTIAAAFSSDGKILASTHGDHTVKIVDCQTGKCIKVLSGHRRTPWVVRFHPLYSDILASGSLDHEVRLWDAQTSNCIGSRDFYRPIASIAFHAQGEILAVASGHKLYMWNYNKRGESSSPTIVLKTRRSLRAVHFHPQAAPFLLTAEVNDLDSPDSPLTLATSSGYLHYPPPAVLFANSNNNNVRAGGLGSMLQRVESFSLLTSQQSPEIGNQNDNKTTPMDITSASNAIKEDEVADPLQSGIETTFDPIMEGTETTEVQPMLGVQTRVSSIPERMDVSTNMPATSQSNVAVLNPIRQSRSGLDDAPAIPSSSFRGADIQMILRNTDSGHLHQLIPFSDPAWWELPFIQGWLIGQTHAGLHTTVPVNSAFQGNSMVIRGTGSGFLSSELLHAHNVEALVASSPMATSVGQSRVAGRSGPRQRSRSRLMASTSNGEGSLTNSQNDESAPHSRPNSIESGIPTSLAAAAAAELPCTVKLRIWPHDMQDPCASLDPEKCRLTIPNAVLCSEMGTHFSPCGRFLVACVACLLPHMEGDPGFQPQMQHDSTGAATSPTRHPIPAHQVMYELRIYSLEEATFGMVLSSRAIRAAHCLTSIQFSPTSEHILLAYGRRHNSLLRSIVIDGDNALPIYTILEVYRVSDMELVRVLPSAEDEVNVACFHPLVGGGLVYGTKEGKLRILQYDGPHFSNCRNHNFFLEENINEIQEYALEC